MSYIHFKSAFSVNFDKITFDGVSLPLSQLKKLISEKSKFQTSKQVNYDLEISNADTGQGKTIFLNSFSKKKSKILTYLKIK